MAKRKGVRKRRRVVYLSRPYEATGFCNGCRSCELAVPFKMQGPSIQADQGLKWFR